MTGPGWSYARIVAAVAIADDTGTVELYRLIDHGLRALLVRSVAREYVEDQIHEIFRVAVIAIRAGRLREPDALMGYIRMTQVRLTARLRSQIVDDRQFDPNYDPADPAEVADPHRVAVAKEHSALMLTVLSDMEPADQEILIRFYFDGQSRGGICIAMGLTPGQYRNRKSRAKKELGFRVAQKLEHRHEFTNSATPAGTSDIAEHGSGSGYPPAASPVVQTKL